MESNVDEKNIYKVKNLEKLKKYSINKLYITEKELKRHLTENEILELLKKGILEDNTLK